MTEKSYFWGGIATGDATLAPYDDDEFSDFIRVLFQDNTDEGVIQDRLNDLSCSGGTTPVVMSTGYALVDGKLYYNDAAKNITISTPVVSTRKDLIVLRKSWASQTVRVEVVQGVEGGGYPSLTQTDGVTWEIPLYAVDITTGGNITLTDSRHYLFEDPEKVMYIPVIHPDEELSIQDGVFTFTIPSQFNGLQLTDADAIVHTVSSSGLPTVQIHNLTDAVDMLSTPITIDASEYNSFTAATQPVISVANCNVATGDRIRIDVDVAGTDTSGLDVILVFSRLRVV